MFDNAASSFRDEAKVFEFWIRSAEKKEKEAKKLKRKLFIKNLFQKA